MKLSADYIEEQIRTVEFAVNGPVTTCTLEVFGGFKVLGTSGFYGRTPQPRCNEEAVARQDAVNQFRKLEQYYAFKRDALDKFVAENVAHAAFISDAELAKELREPDFRRAMALCVGGNADLKSRVLRAIDLPLLLRRSA